jgi:xanthine phosphoribosyltransferase
MQALIDKIRNEGEAIGTQIVKVDGFVNHQIDVAFMMKMGEAFKARFGDVPVDKILTVEASGIAIACLTAPAFGFPRVVFAKKAAPSTMVEGFYAAEAKSFTKGTVSTLRVSTKFLSPGDRILVVDDFLAHGEAALALADIAAQAGAEIVGFGIVIEKAFQGGGARLREAGYRVESLAVIERIEDGRIFFENEQK